MSLTPAAPVSAIAALAAAAISASLILRQKALDDGDLLLFLLRQFGAVALAVQRDRFAALLNHALQHPLDLGLGDSLGIAGAAGGDVAVFEPGEHHAHGRERAGVLGAHRLFEPLGKCLAQ